MNRLCIILVISATSASPLAAGENAANQTIAFVQKLQTPSGGFMASPAKSSAPALPTLRATTSAIRALHYFGGELSNKAACVKFVESCYDPASGGFKDTPTGKPAVFTTAVGLMAVTELKMPTEKYAPKAIKYLSDNAKSFEEVRIAAAGLESIQGKSPKNADWIAEVKKLQNRGGTFGPGPGQARDTGGSVVTLLRLGGAAPKAETVLKVLNAGQHQNGGWGKADSEIASDMETTYRIMRCYWMMKAKPVNVEGVRSFIAKCRNADGGYAVAPGQPSSVGGTYFAAIMLQWLKEGK